VSPTTPGAGAAGGAPPGRPGVPSDLPDVPPWVNRGAVSAGPGAGAPQAQSSDPADAMPAAAHRQSRGRRRSTGQRLLVAFAGLVAVLLVLGVVGAFWVVGHLGGTPGAEVDVRIAPGLTTSPLADLLSQRGVVNDRWLFRWYLSYKNLGHAVPGDYVFHRHEGYTAAVRDLRHGPTVAIAKVTIPEGFTLAQIAERVGRLPGRSSTRFLAVANSGVVRSRYGPDGATNLEGVVFPDTYFVLESDSDESVLQQMVNEMDHVGSSAGLDQTLGGRLANGLTPYQSIIVASMIEREAKVPADRAKIARVILNRLQRGMKLQIDATVIYALGGQHPHLSAPDLRVNSPYNTYRVTGLPPAPICSPSRDSLVAALSPADGPWLYYVLAGADGHHAFASTAAEFDVLVAQARAKGLL
jgi:UPF0755 protein